METTKLQGSLLFQLFCIFITFQVTSQSDPKFIKKASDPIIGYNEEALNFTWTYSNHSSKRIYFGIWNKNYGLVDPSLLTVNIFQNLSFTLHPNEKEFSAKMYIGRVRWVGDVIQQKASFELSNIKDSDAKYYGIEVDFHDTQHDTISSWSNLIVKPPSVFTFWPNNISCGKDQMANFTWKYTLNDIDIKDLNLITFGLYKDGLYKKQCNIQVNKGMVRKSSCSSSSRAHISSLDAYTKVVFVLRNVKLQDEAIYSIRFGGLKRPMENKTMLSVTDHPKITTNPQAKTVTEGSKLILTCFASGKPEPTITWYKDGRVFRSNSNEIYIVNKTKRTDDGTYGCVARNKVGRASSYSARVEVYYAPSINISRNIVNVHVPVGEKTKLRCPAIANPKARYKWFIDGVVERDQVSENLHVTVTSEEDYKKYICNAVNIIGEDNVTFALKQVGPPSTPRVDCDKREDTSKSRMAKFHWNAPVDNGGAPIITYHVKYRTVIGHVRRGPWKYANVSHTETWHKLELEWGKTFEVTVTAWNIYGVSPMDTENTCAVTVGKNPDGIDQLPLTTPKIEAVANQKPVGKSPADLAIYVGPGIGLLVLIVVVALMIRRRNARKKRVKNNWTEQHMSFNAMAIEGNFCESPSSNDKLLRCGSHSLPRKQAMVGSPCYQMDPAWKFPNEKICVLKVIGNGAFGLVYKGRVHCTEENNTGWKQVAIKSPYADATDGEIKDLMKEFELLKTLKPHPHVIKLLGCGEQEGRPLVIIEYVPFGDLLGYLRKSRGEHDDYYSDPEIKPNTHLSSKQLLRFGWNVADGMAYLASEKIIHRDLAARNVLVGEGLSCKITDFGMAKDVSNDDIYVRTTEGRLPVKWTAVEALTGSGEYTTQSDVWSFGVVMYEICTIGSDPYPGIVGKEIPQRLETGYRMTRPRHVDSEVYEVMMCCWETNPEDRPTFPDLKETLIKLEEVESRDYINLAECLYQNVNQTNPTISGTSKVRLGSEKEGVNRGTLKLGNDYQIGPGMHGATTV